MDFSNVTSWTIPEGEVSSVEIDGVTVWSKEAPVDPTIKEVLYSNETLDGTDKHVVRLQPSQINLNANDYVVFVIDLTAFAFSATDGVELGTLGLNIDQWRGNNIHLYKLANNTHVRMQCVTPDGWACFDDIPYADLEDPTNVTFKIWQGNCYIDDHPCTNCNDFSSWTPGKAVWTAINTASSVQIGLNNSTTTQGLWKLVAIKNDTIDYLVGRGVGRAKSTSNSNSSDASEASSDSDDASASVLKGITEHVTPAKATNSYSGESLIFGVDLPGAIGSIYGVTDDVEQASVINSFDGGLITGTYVVTSTSTNTSSSNSSELIDIQGRDTSSSVINDLSSNTDRPNIIGKGYETSTISFESESSELIDISSYMPSGQSVINENSLDGKIENTESIGNYVSVSINGSFDISTEASYGSGTAKSVATAEAYDASWEYPVIEGDSVIIKQCYDIIERTTYVEVA